MVDRHEEIDFFSILTFLSPVLKNDQGKNIQFYEKSLFSCPSSWWRNVWILFMLWLYFHAWFLKLSEVTSKLCEFEGHPYLDEKCCPACWCTVRPKKSGLTLMCMAKTVVSFKNIISSEVHQRPNFLAEAEDFNPLAQLPQFLGRRLMFVILKFHNIALW